MTVVVLVVVDVLVDNVVVEVVVVVVVVVQIILVFCQDSLFAKPIHIRMSCWCTHWRLLFTRPHGLVTWTTIGKDVTLPKSSASTVNSRAPAAEDLANLLLNSLDTYPV